MEVAGGIPPAEIDISVNPDMLHTATSVTTEVSDQEWMEIDTPDPVESGMETTGGSTPAVSDISVGPDVLLTAISVTTVVPEKWLESLQEPMPGTVRVRDSGDSFNMGTIRTGALCCVRRRGF